MKNKFTKEHIRYRFDCIMSSGAVTRSCLLFAVIAVLAVAIGTVAYFVSDEGSLGRQMWISLMHTIDVGTITATGVDNIPYVVLMFIATLCGMVFTTVFIGVVTTAMEDTLSKLRKGLSKVQEKNHTVIIGFNNNVFTILNELIKSSEGQRSVCVVVLGNLPKDKMEETIAAHIKDSKKTRIICRSGNIHDVCSLERCSVETARSVIVNMQNDSETIKTLLALSAYINENGYANSKVRFVASVEDDRYIKAAEISGRVNFDKQIDGRLQVLHSKSDIARVIANTCRQHGLSQVLTELFNYDKNEFYFETIPELDNKTFGEALLSFADAIPVGMLSAGKVILAPSATDKIQQGDQIIFLKANRRKPKGHGTKKVNATNIITQQIHPPKVSDHLFILGTNDKLHIILNEYNKYVNPHTQVVIVDENFKEETLGNYENLEITLCKKTITDNLLCDVLNRDENNVLLLNNDGVGPEQSDSQTLLRLIWIREIAEKHNRKFAITTEMRRVENQRLASRTRVDDFVIDSNYSSLLMTQISQEPTLNALFKELLDEKGSELYMKPVANYVKLGVDVDSYELTESAAQKGEVYIGYRMSEKDDVVINPLKTQKLNFSKDGQVVVIAAK